MAKKNMDYLIKLYSLESEQSYYNMISNLYITDRKNDTKDLFQAMPRKNQKEFIKQLKISSTEHIKYFTYLI